MSKFSTLTRDQKLKQVWRKTHKDFKGTSNGVKSVLVCRGGTQLVRLEDLTESEIEERL